MEFSIDSGYKGIKNSIEFEVNDHLAVKQD